MFYPLLHALIVSILKICCKFLISFKNSIAMKAHLRYNEPNLQIVQVTPDLLGEAILAKTKSTLHCSLLGGESFYELA